MAGKIFIVFTFLGLIMQIFAISDAEYKILMEIDGIVKQHLELGFQELANQNATCFSNQNYTTLVNEVENTSNLSSMLSEISQVAIMELMNLANENFSTFVDVISDLMRTTPESLANTTFKMIGDYMTKQLSGTTGSYGNNATISQINTLQTALMAALKSTDIGKVLLGSSSNLQKIQALLQFAIKFSGILKSRPGNDISLTCYHDVIGFLDVLATKPTKNAWALQMFDALGKLPAGLMRGNLNFIGSYDECKSINATINEQGTRTFGGRYCKTRIGVPDGIMDTDTKGVDLKITLGMCVPDSCTSKDIIGILRLPAIRNYTDILSHDVLCYEEENIRKDNSAIAAIVVYSFVLFLMVLGTLNETITSLSKNPSRSSEYNVADKTTFDKPAALAFINNVYSKDEKITNTTPNGNINGKQTIPRDDSVKAHNDDLPPGYMHHAEGDSKNPLYQPPSHEEPHTSETKISVENNPVTEIVENHRKLDDDVIKPKESLLLRIIKAFSIKTNAGKILAGGSGSESVSCIHGIRFLSIAWIILGHTYNYGLASRINETWSIGNALDAFEILKRFTFQGVYGAGFSVDTFYMLSGLLLTYIQLKHLGKLLKKRNTTNLAFYTVHYYFHRFWRLTPMYMAVLMFFACLYRYIGSGPLWVPQAGDYCKTNWWTNLLYVNNLVNVDDMCMGWSWFLANDMQFYVVSIIFLFFLSWSIPLGSVLICLLMAAGIALAGWKEHIYNGSFLTFKSDGGAFWKNVYIAPWCRVAAFCVGLLTGVIMYKRKKKIFSRKLALLGWAIAVALGLGLVYCTYSENKEGGTPWSRNFRSAYESLGRPLWAVCVAWVIFACHNGRGGIVNTILSWNGIVPLSRLSYAAYLVHPIIMMLNVYSKRSLVYLSDVDIIYLYLGHIVLTFLASFVVSVAFEAPFMALEKIMFPPKR